MARQITNSDDVIDSRDVIERIAELESERQDLTDPQEATDWDAVYLDELMSLRALVDEAEGCGDWEHGAQLVRDDYFKEYAQELAEDIGAIPKDAGWPCQCIDWNLAARELRMDYTAVDFDGVTYWVRS